MTRHECPKCHAQMEAGFLIDQTHGSIVPPHWADGSPDAGWLGVKMKGKTRRAVETMRCVKCGYLESYARETVQ